MSWLKWLPWKLVIRYVARSQGFLDPIALQARLQRFVQPSEVAEPIELLRAGVVFHARGLINSRVIQHNLDWVWPFWVERQFDPNDNAFVPRAFSITHINLTHRNWTAVGVPDCRELPIVDPRGLLTPFLDSWSLDCWIVSADGRWLLPSRAAEASQELQIEDTGPAVSTRTAADGLALQTRVRVDADPAPVCRLVIEASAPTPAWAVLALRPYNPEGISFIREVVLSESRDRWTVNGVREVRFSAPADRHHVSEYRRGDVHTHLRDLGDEQRGRCDIEMTTAAAMFEIVPGQSRRITASIALAREASPKGDARARWSQSLEGVCRLSVPDRHWQSLYDAALRTLVLHTPGDVYAGPFTYKRFWFRDAAFIVHALLCVGLFERAERAIDAFPARQNALGYFHSQEGEWDSNGEVLWLVERYCRLSGRSVRAGWLDPLRRAARWIVRKRLAATPESPHAGLLPAGFSAEHLGPNDYYYWDDYWAVAGLRAAAVLLEADEHDDRRGLDAEADALMAAIERSLRHAAARLERDVLPASPYRRLDSGAIGSLVAGYPLALYGERDPRLLNTVEFLLEKCFVNGGFFQDMIHSGVNCYLTLHVAQVLLRAGDPRYLGAMEAVARLASPTGQWPEAVHPRTGGGCMGDGQHTWAASEWLVMVRNCLVREEGDRLILGSGVPPAWLAGTESVTFGPAPTAFGPLTLTIVPRIDRIDVSWQASWRRAPASIEVRLPGHAPASAGTNEARVVVARKERK
jgi:hypothetical protein